MLAKILSQKHGFDCTVLFAINPDGGYIDSNFQKNIPGTEALDSADLLIIGTRFSSFSYVPAVWGDVPVIETGRHLRVIPWT